MQAKAIARTEWPQYGRSYWSTITDTANSGAIGPLIASIFTPVVAVVTVLFTYLLITVQFERNRELERFGAQGAARTSYKPNGTPSKRAG